MKFDSLFRKKTVEQILQKANEDATLNEGTGLSKHLGVKDLTAFGIAAIIGAGIFSTIGQASADGGPGVIFLFLFTAIACGFAAFAYAEFASMVPVSGSAYTYSYVAFGELTAWIIGWALIMEYGIGNITVAISWSDYFTGLLASGGINLPAWMTMDYFTASKGYDEALQALNSGQVLGNLSSNLQDSYAAWNSAPQFGNFHFVADLPALAIIIFITWLVYKGMRESRNAANVMVLIKLSVVLLIIAVGVFYVDTDNWHPFTPNGISGILKGVSAVFFAYIGFDAISTTAEECVNPQRDLPRGMMWAIIICTILYIAIALVLTGMVSYKELAVGDPLAFVFHKLNLKWLSGIIAVSAVVAMASVLLVFQLGQPRIWMSMSRDGLLPTVFSRIHPKFKTPSFATIVTGFVVAVPALFLNLTMVTNLCSIGTLFAFVLVCAGVLRLQNDPSAPRGKFKTPYINARYISPVLFITACVLCWQLNNENMHDFFAARKLASSEEILSQLDANSLSSLQQTAKQKFAASFEVSQDRTIALENINGLKHTDRIALLRTANLPDEQKYASGWMVFFRNIPMWIFIFISLLLVIWSYTKNLSLIPVLGLVSCLYMMAEIELENWIGFAIWLILGLFIYFGYSYNNSKLNKPITK
ncbi:MAG TPA: amino acid permease [Bacteroidia bacterium]|nr:amino acid permease [Bacteroidia bacterium]HRH07683.1 amino acid permease [Bacteroidia bacterium]